MVPYDVAKDRGEYVLIGEGGRYTRRCTTKGTFGLLKSKGVKLSMAPTLSMPWHKPPKFAIPGEFLE